MRRAFFILAASAVALSAGAALAQQAEPSGTGYAPSDEAARTAQNRYTGQDYGNVQYGADSSIAVRVNALERELQQLTGRVEELSYKLDQANRQIEAMRAAQAANAQNASQASGGYGPYAPQGGDAGNGAAGANGSGDGLPPGWIDQRTLPGQNAQGQNAQDQNAQGQQAGAATGAESGDGTWYGAQRPQDQSGAAPNASAASGPTDLTAPAAAASGAAGAASPAAGGDAQPPARVQLPTEPNAAYDYAYKFLLQGDYPHAEAAFKAYLDTFPNDAKAADAQFRLGEIYMATGAYADAASAFLTHVQTYPNDPRAAESYLKLGASFARLGRTKEACQVFGALRKKFPDASPTVLQRLAAERDRAQCSG